MASGHCPKAVRDGANGNHPTPPFHVQRSLVGVGFGDEVNIGPSPIYHLWHHNRDAAAAGCTRCSPGGGEPSPVLCLACSGPRSLADRLFPPLVGENTK